MLYVWNKYKKIKEISTTSNTKSNTASKINIYLTRIEPIIKEIVPKDKDAYDTIYELLNQMKNEIKIYDIIKENDKIYVVIDNNEETNERIDKILFSGRLNIEKESILEGQGSSDLKENVINCIYTPNNYEKNEIYLLHDYSFSESTLKDFTEEEKKSYEEAKELNQKLFKDCIEIYVNGNIIKFDFKYKISNEKELKVKFKFKTKLRTTSFMF